MTSDADAAELEPEPDDEEDCPSVLLDFVRPKVMDGPWHQLATEPMARRATIQLKVHRQIVQSILFDEADNRDLLRRLLR
jgi:hypothetical protein